jgi:hypothetical protein
MGVCACTEVIRLISRRVQSTAGKLLRFLPVSFFVANISPMTFLGILAIEGIVPDNSGTELRREALSQLRPKIRELVGEVLKEKNTRENAKNDLPAS